METSARETISVMHSPRTAFLAISEVRFGDGGPLAKLRASTLLCASTARNARSKVRRRIRCASLA